ncbi:hypothetical protein K438DRAFT_1934727 [Mycena galopus ATCC 62051]|nr:hypothetical protein K438DRAFT_1934727 [Mycena galopus ATCC 62051]
MNAIYGWSRKMIVFTLFLFCGENEIGLVTTITSVSGGSKGLVGSTGILNCAPHQANVPDVNVASLIINKAMDDVRGVDTEGQGVFSKFGVLLVNLVLILTHNLYAQLGTPWLLATYSVASTRIFLNLKDLALHHYNDATWSEFQQDSAIEFQIQSGLRAGKELGRTLPELQPFRIPAAV